jgi:uncharacterized membrane protein YkoI
MKKLFFALLAFVVLKAQAQTADEVIQKYATAMGGLENFVKLKSVKMSGTVTTQGMDLPITIQVINGRAMRTDVEVMGQTITNSYKDGKGWKINPLQGGSTATDVTGAELNEMKSQSNLASQLMDYKSRGYTAELSGQETVEGATAYKIKLTTEDKKETTYFIDAKTSLIIKSVTKREMMGQEVEIETFFGDVKDFGGVKFTTSRTQKADGQVFQEIHFDKVELNVPIDEKTFDK